MAKINITRLKNNQPDSQQALPSSMYSTYSKQLTPINNQKNSSDYETISVKKEQGKFYKLRQLMHGPNIIPDLNNAIKSNLTQGQLRKIERQENYYRRIQSTVNWGISRNDGDRRLRYMEYDRMEWMTPEVGRALDTLAADATTLNPQGNVVTIECDNEKLEEEANFLFNEILDLNSNAFQYVRDTLKYGDSYYMIHMDAKKGIKKLVPLPTEHVDREVGFDEHNPFAFRYRVASMGGDPLEPYEIAHFRLKTTMDFDEYGKSALENGRRIWRQLITLEDSMIIYRLVRAPQRRIFYFDIGNIRSDQIEAAVNKFANSFKKDRIYDQDGIVDYRLSLQPIHKDSIVPLLDGRTITIEELSKEYEGGKENWVYSIDDETHKNVPGKVVWCGKNYENSEIIKVELDDESYVLSHPDHPFILRDGTSIAAKNLQENMSLMPFYANIDKKGYEKVYDPGLNKFVNTHTFVARDVYKNEFQKLDEQFNHTQNFVPITHRANGGHINPFIKFDNFVWNKLEEKIRNKEIYKQYEAIDFINNELIDYLLDINEDCKKIQNTKKIQRHAFNKIIQRELGVVYEDFRNNILNTKILNHKVKSISLWHEKADVYCMTVVGSNGEDDRHNFAVLPFNMKTYDCCNRYSGIRILNSIDEDYIIPKRGNQDGNKIETLEAQEWAAIDDVKYIHQKFITSLGVPNSYLGFEEALNSKATLGNEDIRYAVYVQRIQKSILQELEKLLLVHLFIRGYRTQDITGIKISLTNPSHINELQELEIFQARLSAERDAKDSKAFSTYWIKKNIWKMTDRDIEDEENQLIRDSIRNFVFSQGEAGVFLTVKDVLDYNSIEAQAAKDAQQGSGMDDEFGGLGGGGGMPMGGDMGGMDGLEGGGMEEPPNPELMDLDNLDAPDELTSPDEINQDIEDNR